MGRLRFALQESRIEILGSRTAAGCFLVNSSLPPFPECRPRRRLSPHPLRTGFSPGSSQSSLKNRTLLPLLHPATRPPSMWRMLNWLGMIPTLFPSLAYSGLSLSLSPSIYVFYTVPPQILHSHRDPTQCPHSYCCSSCWRRPGLFLGRLFFLSYFPYSSLPD